MRETKAFLLQVWSFAALGLALALIAAGMASANHGGDSDHLPPIRKNMEVVSKLEPASQGAVTPNQIGDVAVHKGFAYLASGSNCEPGKGGFYVADIRNPAAPSEVNFTSALPNSHPGEGMQVVTVNTPAFSGDLLAVNNESCLGPAGSGGFDLYDVSNPSSPDPLIRGFGDVGGEGTLTGAAIDAHGVHSIFIWDAGNKAYAAVVDNVELHDLDIFDITDPASPQPVREYDLKADTPAWTESPNGNNAILNDMVVKRIGTKWMLLASYGDAGYIQMDVTNPADAQYVSDTDFGTSDPLTGFDPPEGNAHYAEFTRGNAYIVTAEQDLEPYRLTKIEVEGKGDFPASSVAGGGTPNDLQDGRLNGPMAYGGYACPDNSPSGDTPQPVPNAETTFPVVEPGEERILVVQRGPDGDSDEDYDGDGDITDDDDACLPGSKAATATASGWDAILLINRHTDEGASGDTTYCGAGGYAQPMTSACTTHEAGHQIFDDPTTYDRPYDDEVELAPVGTPSAYKLDATGAFDGWGYMSMYSTTPDENGKMPLVDTYAIPEALNPDYASGFGELSIREQAADPTEPLSYSSYRSGGLRVFSFESGKLTPQGAFIDVAGNDMWGVEQFTSQDGQRLIAGSDRDYGLYIVRYTGPLAPKRPACSDTSASVASQGSVTISLACTDANGNVLTRRIVSGPSAGSLGPINQLSGTVTYTNTGRAGGTDSFRFEASDGAAASASAAATIAIGPAPDNTAPQTTINKATVSQVKRKATFKFSSSEADSTFSCKLDNKPYKDCSSPKTYKRLKVGRHKFKVRATDGAGNADSSAAVKRFRIRR